MAAWIVAVVAAIGAAGCGRRACFEYTTSDWQKAGATCPSATAALPFFGTCNTIASIDGPGTFEDQLCCYPITKADNYGECGVGGATPGSVVGVGVGVASSTGAGPSSMCDGTGICGDFKTGCAACAAQATCSHERFTCTETPGCDALADCTRACLDSACFTGCAQTSDAALAAYDALAACAYCGACASDCAALTPTCKLTSTGPGGTGGAGGQSGGAGGQSGGAGGQSGGAGGQMAGSAGAGGQGGGAGGQAAGTGGHGGGMGGAGG